MLFIRYSYLTTFQLRESNADLLTALEAGVKIAGKVDRAKDLPGKIQAEASLYNWVNSARAAIAKASGE